MISTCPKECEDLIDCSGLDLSLLCSVRVTLEVCCPTEFFTMQKVFLTNCIRCLSA